jgi:ABC-type sugar transport system permease subunit
VRYLLPAIILISIFTFIPAVAIIIVSLFKTNIISWEFVGLNNYRIMWRDFGKATLNTLYYTLIIPIFGMASSVAIALNISRFKKSHQNLHRGAMYVPVFSAGIIIAAFWRWFFSSDGVANWLLKRNVQWFGDGGVVTIAFVVICGSMGAMIMMVSIAINNVNTDEIEAALVDGANEFQIKTRIILPQIMPTVSVLLLFAIVGSLQVWETIYMLAPFRNTASMMYRIFADGFQYGHYGLSAAECVVLLLTILIIGIFREKLTRREDERAN